MPDEHHPNSSSLRQSEDPNDIPFSPTPSFAESFATAYTSQTDLENAAALSPSSSLAPMQGLRKSISVDSFAKFGRDVHPHIAPHSTRVDTSPTLDTPRNLVFSAPAALTTESDRLLFGRHRGSSIGSVQDGGDSAADSDVERSDPLSSSVERYRHSSLKDQSRPHIRGGELPLPSRTPTLSSTSSMSSMITTSTSSSTMEDVPRQQSLSSIHSYSGRPIPIAPTGRIRSGSLGTYTNPARHALCETRQSVGSLSGPPVTLIVVGTAGCGKSVAIRKGLRGHGLSEPTSVPVLSMQGTSTRYSRRVGTVRNQNAPDSPLHVIEIDVPTEPLEPRELDWPDSLSTINGVIICYDASDKRSFQPVEGLLRGYQAMKLPLVVLACKSDLPHEVEPEKALEVLEQYDVGLVEVAKTTENGKGKMRRTFEWILKAVARDKRTNRSDFDANYRNPASPDVLISPPPWENSRTATPTASSSVLTDNIVAQGQIITLPSLQSPPAPPIFPNTPARARSTGDLLYESEKLKALSRPSNAAASGVTYQGDPPEPSHPSGTEGVKDKLEIPESKEGKEKESRPGQWATLEELLDKLLFLAVSGDDPAYITHFLLTYRRFASPRSVLLAMQKRMRQLDNPSGDPMFACFAQMRICHLLEMWIRDYPYDFAVRGTAGALSALIKSIISKTYLLHYGSEFLPFLEMLPNLVDQDAAWALKVDDIADESDDSYSLLEDEEIHPSGDDDPVSSSSPLEEKTVPPLPSMPSRERKPSLPLPLVLATGATSNSGHLETDTSDKQQIKDLIKLSQELQAMDSEEIAQEITRIEVKLFLDIKPRHWLYYTFVSGKKDENEPITAFNAVSNHLADWVVSLVLCHKTPRARVKQIEKLVEIAQKLRALNNYSALRAFVAGINNATFAGDETMEQFKAKSPEQAKNLQSWDVLLQHIRSHRAYRLALRNSKGACIPALEVHMSDLIRAHEGNGDFHASDPTKIHWGKFNMMGRFISSTAQCQAQCRTAADYNFVERPHIGELLRRPVMNDQLQKSRIAPMDTDFDDYRPSASGAGQPRDAAILRRLFFW
ncbi:putative guanine nucleotide exchange factor for Ras-like small GTPases [Lyophyllum shimeji]|uniref:Guanine nucleotide exchange factor for Ras-like small GTPases n=1 Tax=Lyophyllum shimeji TaxID=47721 RepID=A0A9P3PHG3_LYOSH|nr:putative guanine nucleotide exchange factor for Ras-like small GTPases [Lyophyllum shimeji]